MCYLVWYFYQVCFVKVQLVLIGGDDFSEVDLFGVVQILVYILGSIGLDGGVYCIDYIFYYDWVKDLFVVYDRCYLGQIGQGLDQVVVVIGIVGDDK